MQQVIVRSPQKQVRVLNIGNLAIERLILGDLICILILGKKQHFLTISCNVTTVTYY